MTLGGVWEAGRGGKRILGAGKGICKGYLEPVQSEGQREDQWPERRLER